MNQEHLESLRLIQRSEIKLTGLKQKKFDQGCEIKESERKTTVIQRKREEHGKELEVCHKNKQEIET